jgi:hypothetical protein
MNLIWHIFKKDFRCLGLPILLWVLSGFIYMIMMIPLRNHLGVPSSIVVWLVVVTSISFAVWFFALVAGVVQEDNLIDSTVFWRTRPISPGRLLAAKSMFIVGLLVVVPLVGFIILRGFLPLNSYGPVNWHNWRWSFAGLLSAALFNGGLAACTKNFRQFMLAVFLSGLVYTVIHSWLDYATIVRNVKNDAGHFRALEFIDMLSLAVIGLGGVFAMLNQYLTRRRVVTVILLSAAVLGTAVIQEFWVPNFLNGK